MAEGASAMSSEKSGEEAKVSTTITNDPFESAIGDGVCHCAASLHVLLADQLSP